MARENALARPLAVPPGALRAASLRSKASSAHTFWGSSKSSRPMKYAAEYFTGDIYRSDMGRKLLTLMSVLYQNLVAESSGWTVLVRVGVREEVGVRSWSWREREGVGVMSSSWSSRERERETSWSGSSSWSGSGRRSWSWRERVGVMSSSWSSSSRMD